MSGATTIFYPNNIYKMNLRKLIFYFLTVWLMTLFPFTFLFIRCANNFEEEYETLIEKNSLFYCESICLQIVFFREIKLRREIYTNSKSCKQTLDFVLHVTCPCFPFIMQHYSFYSCNNFLNS